MELDDNWPKAIREIKFKNEKLATLLAEALRAAMNTLIYDTLPAFTNKSVGEALMEEVECVSFRGEFFVLVRDGPNLKLVKKNK
ncbi:MAG: hypothetical protein NTX00_05285 [Candidatus Parcubacteria bacterium]|nr:hypothetical protein [Candidatus Parcubacteria bacterium]